MEARQPSVFATGESVEHGMLVVDVPALLLYLPLPLVLLQTHFVQHAAARTPCALLHRQSLVKIDFLVDVLLVGSPALVEQRIEAHEEEHVDGEQGDDPYDQDDQHPDGGGVAALIAARASRAKLALASFDIHRLWQDHTLAVASPRGHVHDIQFSVGLCAADDGRAWTDALAADILILRLN